jgi:hypothetical protein
MAELVADDALKFVALQRGDAAAGDPDGSVIDIVAGSEGVDALPLRP